MNMKFIVSAKNQLDSQRLQMFLLGVTTVDMAEVEQINDFQFLIKVKHLNIIHAIRNNFEVAIADMA